MERNREKERERLTDSFPITFDKINASPSPLSINININTINNYIYLFHLITYMPDNQYYMW